MINFERMREYLIYLKQKCKRYGSPFDYPLRSYKLTIDISLFSLRLKPRFYNFKRTESQKREGLSYGYFEWLMFRISFGRWL